MSSLEESQISLEKLFLKMDVSCLTIPKNECVMPDHPRKLDLTTFREYWNSTIISGEQP